LSAASPLMSPSLRNMSTAMTVSPVLWCEV
jgi:hypothetical protein